MFDEVEFVKIRVFRRELGFELMVVVELGENARLCMGGKPVRLGNGVGTCGRSL